MDVLSTILNRVKLSSAVYFKSDFSAPWGMDIPEGPFAQFHIITRGQCSLITKKEKLQLFAGDIVVFPLGTNHGLADELSSERKNGQMVVESIVNGKSLFRGTSIATTLICGHFDFDRNFDHPFINELPEIIYITDSERKELSWLESLTNLIIKEADSENFGAELLLRKLGEILFIHSLRAFIQKNRLKSGFLVAVQDKKIGAALNAIHRRPEQNWQLASLAQIAGMSRTSFSNRFKLLVGETPLTYITHWRISEAKQLLKESKKSVGEIAEKVGYQSEAAFNRVFKKLVAQTPLKYRKTAHLVEP